MELILAIAILLGIFCLGICAIIMVYYTYREP